MPIINNKSEGMIFIIDNNSLGKILKIKKYYPKASIKIESDKKPKPKVSIEELKMLVLSEIDDN